MEDWFENLSKEEKEEIEKGIKQTSNNECVDHDVVMTRFSKWRKYVTISDKRLNLEP